VLRDVSDGLASTAHAREVYGVVIDTDSGSVDEPATAALRNDQQARVPRTDP
jgi:hypothetical protein